MGRFCSEGYGRHVRVFDAADSGRLSGKCRENPTFSKEVCGSPPEPICQAYTFKKPDFNTKEHARRRPLETTRESTNPTKHELRSDHDAKAKQHGRLLAMLGALAAIAFVAFIVGAIHHEVRKTLNSVSLAAATLVNEASVETLAAILRHDIVDLLYAASKIEPARKLPNGAGNIKFDELVSDFDRLVTRTMVVSNIVEIKVHDLAGSLVYSSGNLGEAITHDDEGLLRATLGVTATEIEKREIAAQKGGLVVTSASTYVPIYDESGRVVGVFETYTNITDLASRLENETSALVGYLVFAGTGILLALAFCAFAALYFLRRTSAVQ